MRALASNLEASRTFEAPLSPQKSLNQTSTLARRFLRLPLTTDVSRLRPLNALAIPRRRARTGLDCPLTLDNTTSAGTRSRPALLNHSRPCISWDSGRVVTHPSVCPAVLPPPGFAALQRHDQ